MFVRKSLMPKECLRNILRQKKYYWFKFTNLGKYLGGSWGGGSFSPPLDETLVWDHHTYT